MNQPILTTQLLVAVSALFLISLSSCESDAFFTVPDGDTKIYAFAEISPDEQINVFVNTAVGINTDDEFYFPDQGGAKVVLFEDGMPLENPGFRYIRSKKAFVSQGSFRAKPGVKYGLEVSLKENSEVKTIFGETTIPEADSLANVKLTNSSNNFDLSINLFDTQNDYFLIKSMLFDSEGQEHTFTTTDIVNNGRGVIRLGNNRVLLSREDLQGSVRIKGESEITLSGGTIQLELQSITMEAYQYYKSYALQAASQDLSVSEPVISMTNFENGLGLFSGFSSKSTKILIP